MRQIDREGIFRVVPREWRVRTTESSASVAVSFDFGIDAQWNGQGWDDWSGYELHTVYGDWWVIKKDRNINQGAVEQLANSLGWNGSLDSVNGQPPQVFVQVTVKAETYEDKTRYKAGWMNPGDFTPGPVGAPPAEVAKLQLQFGSLLRAAASGAAKAAKLVPAPERKTEKPPPPGDADMAGPGGGGGVHPASTGDDDLPFAPTYH